MAKRAHKKKPCGHVHNFLTPLAIPQKRFLRTVPHQQPTPVLSPPSDRRSTQSPQYHSSTALIPYYQDYLSILLVCLSPSFICLK